MKKISDRKLKKIRDELFNKVRKEVFLSENTEDIFKSISFYNPKSKKKYLFAIFFTFDKNKVKSEDYFRKKQYKKVVEVSKDFGDMFNVPWPCMLTVKELKHEGKHIIGVVFTREDEE